MVLSVILSIDAEGGVNAGIGSGDGFAVQLCASENARLKRALQRAQMERDILKKAALIFGTASR